MVPLFLFIHVIFICAYFILPFPADFSVKNDVSIYKKNVKSLFLVLYKMYIIVNE